MKSPLDDDDAMSFPMLACGVGPHIAPQRELLQQAVRDELGKCADVVCVAHEPGSYGQQERRYKPTVPPAGEVHGHLTGGGRSLGKGVMMMTKLKH